MKGIEILARLVGWGRETREIPGSSHSCRGGWRILLLMGLGMGQVFGAEATSERPVEEVSFRRDVAPILARKCLQCHNAEKSKGGYRLDQFSWMLKAGESESKPIELGVPEKSELYQRLITTDEDDRMPQKDDPLPAGQIDLIRRWIAAGGIFDGTDTNAFIKTLLPRGEMPLPPEKYLQSVPVTGLAFGAGGRELAVSGYHEVTVWEPSAGALVSRIHQMPQRIQAVAWSPDGRWLGVAGGTPGVSGEVVLVDRAAGTVARVLGTGADLFLAVLFSHDGKTLAAGGTDNSIRLFDVETGRERLVIQQHADWVTSLAFSDQDDHLASGSRDRTARVYNVKTGELESTYTEHNAPVFSVAFADEGKKVCSAGRDKKLHLWTIADGKKAMELSGHEGEIFRVLVEGDWVFSSGADRQVRMHSIREKKLIHTFSGHKDWVYSLAWDSVQKRLASGSYDGEVRIWDPTERKLDGAFSALPGRSELTKP